MKKISFIILSSIFLFSVAGCGKEINNICTGQLHRYAHACVIENNTNHKCEVRSTQWANCSLAYYINPGDTVHMDQLLSLWGFRYGRGIDTIYITFEDGRMLKQYCSVDTTLPCGWAYYPEHNMFDDRDWQPTPPIVLYDYIIYDSIFTITDDDYALAAKNQGNN